MFFRYFVNHIGNRVAQAIASSTTNYLWDEFSRYGDVILETNSTNTIGYTLANGMLVAQTNNGNIDYFLQDAQNTTVGITDSSGTLTSSYSYDAFGNLDDAIDPLSLETNYLYTGQQFDPIYTELYNLRARQYDPSNGRFTRRDTWAYDLGNPIELNRYVYTANNPVNYVDPSGYLKDYSSILSSDTFVFTGARSAIIAYARDASIGALASTVGYVIGKIVGYKLARGFDTDVTVELFNRNEIIMVALGGALLGIGNQRIDQNYLPDLDLGVNPSIVTENIGIEKAILGAIGTWISSMISTWASNPITENDVNNVMNEIITDVLIGIGAGIMSGGAAYLTTKLQDIFKSRTQQIFGKGLGSQMWANTLIVLVDMFFVGLITTYTTYQDEVADFN